MKNNQDKEFKRWLKNKLSVTQALMIHFLITGSLSMFGLAAMSLSSNVAYGAVNIGSTTDTTISKDNAEGWGISIGNNAKTNNDHDISIGVDAGRNSSGSSRSITIGSNSRAGDTGYSVNQSIAIGGGVTSTQGAWAKGDQSVSIGGNTRSDGHSSIAIGGDDLNLVASQQISYVNAEDTRTSGNIRDAMKNLTGVDILSPEYSNTMSGHGAVALGVKAVAGHLSLAIGTAATAGAIGTNENIEYKAVNTVAIGSGATAMLDNAIAIGGGAKADDSNPGKKQIGATIKSIQYTWSGGDKIAAGDIVSFGAAGFERQLKNVAPGAVSDKSTDAINGSQLFGIAKNITSENHLKFLGDDGQNDATKVINLSLEKNRLNIVGGAKTDNLSDENIGVVYENGNNKGADGKDLDTENPDYQEGKLKIKLAKELKNLKSAEFKTDTGDKTVINGNGVTITPVTAGKEQVSLTKDGLNNGGNLITNIASNLDGAKTGTTVPTTKADAPINVDDIKNNAATVGDVLQSGWNLQGNGEEKDFVKPYDTVNFANGNGTTVVVETKGNKVSTIKYNVNTGDIESVTTGDDSGTVKVKEGDKGKIATVDSVVNAVNSAAFTLKASATTGGTRNGSSSVDIDGEDIKAGKTIEMIAGKNLNVTHNNNGKITFATVDTPSFSTVQLGGSKGPKFSKTADGDIKVSDKDDTEPVKITNVKNGSISEESKDAINGSQFHELATNKIKLAGQNGNKASGETDAQNLNQENGIKFTVKSSDGELLEVTASGDTITLTPKTATITTDTDGVPTATTTNGKLVTADDLITTLKGMGWKAVAGKDGTGLVTGNTETLVKSGETVTFKAGDNLKIKQDGKNFIYSLNTALTSLTSAEFKDANNNKVNIIPTGIIITKPENTDNNEPEKTVTLNQDGLNNGGNLITNIASNLDGAKTGTTVPTTKADAPINVDDIKNNAATVGDVLQSGWNLQGNGEEKDFVKPYDTVNFANGDGTTATVETTNNKVSTVKYSVNLGDGLKKDDTGNNTISIKPADKSLEVNKDGLKVKTDDTTITTDDNKGLKVVTGAIESVTTGNDSGTVKVKEGDTGKIATVDSVVNAVNSAAFTLKASATTGGTRNGSSSVDIDGEDIKAGKTIEMIAGKNLNVTHNENGKIIFATVDTPTFSTVQVGGDQGPKFSKTSDGDIKVSDKDGTNPVKVTNVKDGAVTDTSTDAINGSQFHKVANNAIKLAGQNGDDATTATQTKEQNLNKQGGIKFTVKSSDGKLLEVKAADDTITLTPKTATITTGEDGIPTANIDSGKLVTAEDLVTALKNMGWKAIAGQEGSGTVAAGNAEQLIKAGEIVTFKAGNNLAVKQAGKEFIYSLKQELTDLTKVEVKDADGNKVVTTPIGTTVTDKDGNVSKLDGTGLTITPNGNTSVSVTKDGIKAGDKAITNVASNLTNYDSGNKNGLVDLSKIDTTPNSNVATVGDLRNMGWVVSSNKTTDALETEYNDKVKNADEVKFVGTGAATVSGKTDNKGVRTITVDVTVPSVEKGTINVATDEADKGKVVANKGDENKFTTVDTVVNAINSAAWKVTSDKEGTGNTATIGHTQSKEEIKAGDIVIFKAGDNLIIKQSGKEFTYSLNPELTNLSKVEVKDTAGNAVVTTPTGTTITGKDTTDPTKDITTVINAGGTTVTDKDGNTTKVDGNGITITSKNDPANPVKLTKDGLNNAGNTITNVAGNLEGAKKDTNSPTNKADAPNNVDNIKNNAATVGDVLNAGWNLQNNGTAKDFVRPYDTVNFINGGNTTAVVTTNAEGTTSNVTYNVTGLPVTYTNEDGKPVSKVGDNYYLVNDKGQPLQDNGTPVTKYDPNGNPLNDNGTPVTKVDTTAKPLKTNLVNPNVATDKQTTTPSQLGNVANGSKTYDAPEVNGEKVVQAKDGKWYKETDVVNGTANENATAVTTPINPGKSGLVDFSKSNPTNVATVGDLQNLGWVVSSDKTTGDLEKAYNDQVRNANEVKFVGKGTATVSGKTVDGVRTITVEVNDQVSTNNSVTPVVYTKADGTPVYPIKQTDGTTKFFEKPDGTGAEVPKTDVITSVNGPDGTKNPTILKNIAGNLEGAKKDTNSPINKADAPNNVDAIKNNAATVGDVLNAGWNLQANRVDVDFVKPYDTVNFVDGIGTTVEATTDNKVSHIKFHTVARYSDENGTPIKKDSTDGKYYPINPDGTLNKTVPGIDNPQINLVNGNPGKNPDGTPKEGTTVPTILSNLANGSNPTYTDGKGNTLVKVGDSYYKEDQLNDNGKPKDGATPSTDTPLKMGTDGKWYPADSVPVNGKYYPADTVVINGKPYEPGTVNVNGKPYPAGTVVIDGKPYEAGTIKDKDTGKITKDGNDATPLTTLKDPITTTIEGNTINNPGKAGLSDLSKSKATNAATIGDLNNMGWVVSSDKTTDDLGTEYNDQVRNANEVKFIGTGMATVSGKTVDNIRTITVDVNAQKTVETAQIPVVYTDNDGNKLTKIGDKFYNVNNVPEGVVSHNGNLYPAGSVVSKDGNVYPQGTTLNENGAPTVAGTKPVEAITPVNNSDVKASMNSGDNTTSPTTLSNIAGNLEGAKKDTNSPTNKADAPNNVDNIKNNAATVGDVLNAGWNLQNNGTAKDFVRPYDTVNFINGGNTTAVVTTNAEGTTSNVTYNVTGLPVTYTNEDGKPVSKVGDNYYLVNDKGQPLQDNGTPVTKYDPNGNPLNDNGTPVTKVDTTAKPLKTNLVNPNVATDKQTTTPSQLGNVANGSKTYDAPEVNGEKVVQAKDGKWYKETDVVNGTANENATAVTTPINPGKSGLVDFSKSNPTNVATVGDLQNLGWVVSSDKTTGALGTEYNDQVRNANEVKFIGKNGIQVSGKTDDKGVKTLTFEMEPGEITPTEIVKPDDNKLDKKVVAIGNKVYNAEDIDTNGKPKKDAVPVGTIVDGKVYDNKDLNADGKPNDNASPIAKVKENDGAKFVTGNQVADAIEKSGFIVGKNQGLSESDFENKDEKINPNDELRFADGRNTNVKLATKDIIDATGKVKTVTTVKVDVVDLPITYTDESGKVVVKGKDGKFYYPEALDGKVYDEKEKTYKNPDGTALAKQPEAKENIQANLVNPNVSNTDTEPNKQTTTPTQLGNIANGANTFAKEGKQIANDGKWYNEGDVLPNGKPKENASAVEKPETVGKAGLIDFENSKPNNAATVGDLQNLGWVVSSDKTTGDTTKPYNDQVRNSNEVKFVGKNGIQVSGKTDDKGVRTLTFEMETGEIIPTEIIKADGKTKLIKVGDKAYNPEDIGTDGKAKDGVKPVGTIAKDGNVYNVTDVDDKGNVITQEGKPAPTPIATNTPNNGTKVVTGNQVADALEKSGFVVGKSKKELSSDDFKNEDEKVNPNDELRFADGRNTNVKLATKEVIDASGKVKTVTTVKVDVEGLPITYTNKDGKPIVKKGDKFYLLDEKGNATDTEVKADDIKTNLVAPNSKPNEIGTPQSLGNVASGLKAADIKTDANKSDDKEVVKALITTTEDDKKLNTVANLDDLKTLSKAGLDFGANKGDVVHRNLGEKVSILGNDKVTEKDANDETKFSSKNVVTTTDPVNNSINIKFSQNPEFDSIKIGNRHNKPVVSISSEGIDAGNTKITNVAPGEISDTSQDAINGSQLSGVLKGINAGIASSVAMANLPQVSNIGMHRHNIAAAIGIHRGESAIALGISGLNHRGSLVYKASGALNTKGHVTFGVGLGYQFDRNTRDNDTHRNDIIDLKEKLEDIMRENSEYKQEIQEYRKEQEQNKVIIEQLMKRLEALEKTK